VGLLVLAPLVIVLLRATGIVRADHFRELMRRYWSWCALVPLMLAPVLLGAAWLMVAAGLLGCFCFREFAQVVGLAPERRVVACVYLGIALVTLAALDNWYGFFVALMPLTCGTIAAVAILDDRPHGYIQRVALGVWGFMLFGSGLAHLGYLGNDAGYRPLVLVLLLSVELNDVFAYCCGKLFGRKKLAPQTSPNKTLAGSLGALVLTTPVVAGLGYFVFADSELAKPWHLITLGLIVSLLGQLGDLMLSSVKRDVGVKDMGALIPGHGGLLDRFDSLLLVAPAVFHYVHYFRGVGLNEAPRVFL
jgi:phosphatidate cytidylyltransferase